MIPLNPWVGILPSLPNPIDYPRPKRRSLLPPRTPEEIAEEKGVCLANLALARQKKIAYQVAYNEKRRNETRARRGLEPGVPLPRKDPADRKAVKRACDRKWYAANIERLRAANRARYHANKQRLLGGSPGAA